MGKWREGTVTLVVLLCAGIFFWRLNTGIQDAIEYAYPTVTWERLLLEFGIALGTAIPFVYVVIWKWDDIKEHIGVHTAAVKAIDAAKEKPEQKKKRKKARDSVLEKVVIQDSTAGRPQPPSVPRSGYFVRRP